MTLLVRADRYAIDAALFTARARTGSWAAVADEIGEGLVELGEAWARGSVTVAEEHRASEALTRGLSRVGDTMPTPAGDRWWVLACLDEEGHSLGLALAELCLRSRGFFTVWLGRFTPLSELVRLVRSGRLHGLALSASAYSSDESALRYATEVLAAECSDVGCPLVLGGRGAWPESLPRAAKRVKSIAELDEIAVKMSRHR